LREEQRDPDKFHWIRQGLNENNTIGQEEMGREILAQTGGKVDVFLASVATGGSFFGVARVLKEANPNTICIALLPGGWEGFENPLDPNRKLIPGINDGITKEIIDSGICDETITYGNEEPRAMAYRLSREEGLFVGISSGANVLGATMVAKRDGMAGKNIVTLLVDRGDRYLNDESYIT
jgi:cysteine synthase A